ncbi:MAG TPA: hypothetical protein VFU90_04060, partial [Candidatus Tumulicola sp.]|nr:hypothetical protein [Candidatus Tumulicola sp.]
MRAPTFVSVFALLLIGCGDDASRTGEPGDSSASDVGSEAGNPIDAGAFDATAPRDATHADAPSSPSSNADASGIADATGNVDSRAVDAMSAADASAVNGPDGNGEDAGPCANGSWDGGFCCGAANTPTPEGPDDCGRCGHRCGGGACSSGVCQPFVVATLPDTFGPYDIAANDSLVFVSGMNSNEDASVIYSVPLDGGGAHVLTHASDPPVQLFADPSTLYWAGIQSISSDSIDGGGVTTIAARDTSSIAGFGADPSGAFLYWGEVSNT